MYPEVISSLLTTLKVICITSASQERHAWEEVLFLHSLLFLSTTPVSLFWWCGHWGYSLHEGEPNTALIHRITQSSDPTCAKEESHTGTSLKWKRYPAYSGMSLSSASSCFVKACLPFGEVSGQLSCSPAAVSRELPCQSCTGVTETQHGQS